MDPTPDNLNERKAVASSSDSDDDQVGANEKADSNDKKACEGLMSFPDAVADFDTEVASKINVATAASRQTEPGAYSEGSVARFRNLLLVSAPPAPPPETQPSGSSLLGEDNVPGGTTLVEAKPVCELEDSNTDLEEAQPVDDKTDEGKISTRRKPVLGIFVLTAGFCVIVLVVLVVLAVVLAPEESQDREDANRSSPTTNETSAPGVKEYLASLLPEDLLQPLLSIHADSKYYPQKLALEWLSRDPHWNNNYTDERLLQRYALATFYYATGGPQWDRNDHWLSYNHHECDWYGGDMFITWAGPHFAESPCHNETGRYERLWLARNNLNGTLPEELYSLTSLQSIDLLDNGHLVASVSSRIQQLDHLTMLSMVAVPIQGTIPSEIGTMSRLKILYLGPPYDSNKDAQRLQGSIPSEFWQLSQLEQFTLHQNQLTGTIPTELGLMKNLSALGLQSNQFQGTIPSEWGQLTKLRYNYIYDNQFSGAIPTETGLLQSLDGLHMYNNLFSGPIPTELGLAAPIKELLLANNTLTGTVPSELGQLTNLYMMYLSHNAGLHGSLPTEFFQLTRMEAFDVQNTSIVLTGSDNGTLALQQAQDAMSFYKYHYECQRLYPCENERPEGSSNSEYERPSEDSPEDEP